ncbi:2OG-Fe(II) oxygenase [Rhodopila sp.]|uniref:2OG-Fe(II) oxygenase n=1 Tax=Rhodopila sp. TaxID=2480087 RepID=UPI002C43FFEF|nr:2OG-Fe(II) oxygenase [Rhodopila sp.]HVZ08152.1 2OG-Fe(II) oxygenase [Rhodopila sp.]
MRSPGVPATAMPSAEAIADTFLRSLGQAVAGTYPFRHWLLTRMLPPSSCAAVDALDVAPPPIGDTLGKRETHNSSRLFFGVRQRAAHAVCNDIAHAFQGRGVVRRLEQTCGVCLSGSSLRIEYCLDTDGFWLEPHTDIGAKLFTMLIYLSEDPGSEAWGTDLYDADRTWVGTTPYARNAGLIFIPGPDTWHGVERRPIKGVRRSLIVNYVKPEWRSRHELAFPEQAVE